MFDENLNILLTYLIESGITEELLILLKENRVNRISIGVETFNNKYLEVFSLK